MLKKITEFFRSRYIGIDLFNERIKFFGLEEDIYFDKKIEEVIPGMLEDDFWCNQNSLNNIVSYVVETTPNSLFGPKTIMAVPHEIQEQGNQRLIMKAGEQARVREIYLVNAFICSAIGVGMEVKESKKKIYVCSFKNKTYLGIVFAGEEFYIQVLNKGYDQIEKEDIEIGIESLTSEIKTEMPEQLQNLQVDSETMSKLQEGWAKELENKVYLSVPSGIKNKLGTKLGNYQLSYFKYENNIEDGLKKILEEMKTGGFKIFG